MFFRNKMRLFVQIYAIFALQNYQDFKGESLKWASAELFHHHSLNINYINILTEKCQGKRPIIKQYYYSKRRDTKLNIIFFDFSVEGSFADTEDFGRLFPVAFGFSKCICNGLFFQLI